MNTDGAYKGGCNIFSGGILRDHDGAFMGGFTCNVFGYSAFHAEVTGMYYGLLLCWRKGYQSILVESDNKILISWCKNHDFNSAAWSLYSQHLFQLLKKPWHLQFKHTHREGNRCADWMANLAVTRPIGVTFFEQPPIGCVNLMLAWQDLLLLSGLYTPP